MVNHYKKYLCNETKIEKAFLYLLLFSFLNYIGCYSSRVADKKIFLSANKAALNGGFYVITYSDEIFEIDWKNYEVIDDTLYAKGLRQSVNTYFGQPTDIRLALSEIKYVEVEELDVTATAGCIIGSAGLLILIIGAIASASSVDKTPRRCEVGK